MKLTPVIRKRLEQDILAIISEVDVSGNNTNIYKEHFKKWTDDELLRLYDDSSDGIPIYAPVGGPVKIDHVRNIAVAKKLGIALEQRLWLTEPKTGLVQRTRYPHLILRLPVRRQTQLIDKKLSVAEHDRVKDKLTGQVTGPSKASGFSFPETYATYSQGYDKTLEEFVHARGGNEKLHRAFYQSLRQKGSGRFKLPGAEVTAAKATRTWSAIYTAMHIGNNMGGI